MLWRHLYRAQQECPYCGSHDISRSRRRGAVESLLKWVLHLRPYLCRECSQRFFGYVGAVRVEPSREENEAA